ncbi:SDR family NAD(P)-dependent oxidoreductase [Catenovulum sp. SM1970]|uniref:SDR family NAD(P)-dependent oxidoreductase n=1 Tax=Marinifaba aquimaris TaxID=2741323 RepID=UPI001573D4FC|nr:SDR family NAD(P)-dependent oxidoreductase [Marinifaba aquimaris]NTS76509.1 SDR family NAD(P)-dependent oxidoreductase [Marinifaba aquimaris]
MAKTIFLTGATDGIGLATAHMLADLGHNLIIHGRNAQKLADLKADLADKYNIEVESYQADLSDLQDVKDMVNMIKTAQNQLDVIINNAGVFKTDSPVNEAGLDVRFVVNTIAPYMLSQGLLSVLKPGSRIINLSSAAQASVDYQAFNGNKKLSAGEAYAQSKLAITQWSIFMADEFRSKNIIVIPVNPGSLLASKMVKEGYGIAGGDIQIGAKILTHLSLDAEYEAHSGQYFDNDAGQFANPHPDALDANKNLALINAIESLI